MGWNTSICLDTLSADPLLFYIRRFGDAEASYATPEVRKREPVALVGPDGAIYPAQLDPVPDALPATSVTFGSIS
jgi:hypothetical protein